MQFKRVVSLVVGANGEGVDVSALRVAFSIRKTATKTPNDCVVKIWNLRPESRAKVEVIGAVVILKAGYELEAGPQTIFSGNVTRALTVRDGADWVTELELRDGHLEFRDTSVSLAYSPGTSAKAVLNDLLPRFGLAVAPLPQVIGAYPDGFSFVGRLRDAVDKVAAKAGLEWSIQNRVVQVVVKGQTLNRLVHRISPSSGLIGSPAREQRTLTDKAAAKEGYALGQAGVQRSTRTNRVGETKEVLQVFGYKIKSLLLPSIYPGSYVQLSSHDVKDEFFRVEELTHVGDTHGDDWHTDTLLRFLKNG